MTPWLFLATAAAGGLGAAARLALDGAIRARGRMRFPLGTMVINVSGSLLLGLLSGLVASGVVPEGYRLVVGTGFLGGYTTFSTASFETVRLLRERRPLLAVASGIGMAVLATAAAALGLVLGGLGGPG